MDDTDARLISALRHDARASLSDLSIQLGLSRTTVRARMEKLQNRGEIIGFSVVLREDTLRDPVRGLMMIGIEGARYGTDHPPAAGHDRVARGSFHQWTMGCDCRDRDRYARDF